MTAKTYATKTFERELPNGDVVRATAEIHSLDGRAPYFSLTGEFYDRDRIPGEAFVTNSCGRRRYLGSCGQITDEIAAAFPELVKYQKWHLTSTDGPVHYLANTVYHASDRDHNGRAAGEPSRWQYGVRFGDVPVTHLINAGFWKFLKERSGTGDFQVAALAHEREPQTYGPHYTFVGFGERWHQCPFRSKVEADEFCQAMNTCAVEFVQVATDFSKGKERDLDAARSTAVWPEATDEELTAPNLKERLIARLPALMEAFRADMSELFGEQVEFVAA